MSAKNIMFQGTASSVGKSVITAAFCRIFKQDGHRVAPFKSQNMALNSYITLEGGEMGRAQVVQAEAAGIEPTVNMNPVLIKPTSDCDAQVIVRGKVYQNMSAGGYDDYKPRLMDLVLESYWNLADGHEIILLEGAGSPAEINLRERDIVNMGMAERVDAPVILIGDIDKGGVFASLYGTMMLLDLKERMRIKGFIINKFRGDYELLKPGLEMIENLTNIPVLGVVPWFDLCIDDEDSVTDRFSRNTSPPGVSEMINIGVVNLPYMSNYTDFAPLEKQDGVSLRYFNRIVDDYQPDLVILPGSKNTTYDLKFFRDVGLEGWLKQYYNSGGMIMGICGGFQMLGQKIFDPDLVESAAKAINGLGYLDILTNFSSQKITTRVKAAILDLKGTALQGLSGAKIEGYEIHMGVSTPVGDVVPFTGINSRLDAHADETDGYVSPNGRVFGTYIHGIFDTPDFLGRLLKILRNRKGQNGPSIEAINYRLFKDSEYDRLAEIVRQNVDVERIYEIIFKEKHNATKLQLTIDNG
jgi:adenosylcobyric acid synthase